MWGSRKSKQIRTFSNETEIEKKKEQLKQFSQ